MCFFLLHFFSNWVGLVILVDNYPLYCTCIFARVDLYKVLFGFYFILTQKNDNWYNYFSFSITDLLGVVLISYLNYIWFIPIFNNSINHLYCNHFYLKSVVSGFLKIVNCMPVLSRVLTIFSSIYNYFFYFHEVKKLFCDR